MRFGLTLCCILLILTSCAIVATRPVQEMSNTAAAIRAAKEVQADSRAPELYRQANEWFFKARQEYKLKNFKEAKNYATKARKFAEEAEFEALNTGATRTSAAPPDPYANADAPAKKSEPSTNPPDASEPSESPAPKGNQGTFVDSYEDQEQFRRKLEIEKAGNPPAPPPTNIVIEQNPGIPPTTTAPLASATPAPKR